MPLKYIYFDLDNTLLDHNQAESKSHEAIHSIFPILQNVTMEDWLKTYQVVNHNLWVKYQDGEISRIELHYSRFHDTLKELGLDTKDSEEIGTTYMNKYRNFWDWVDQAEETLKLTSKRFKVGIITNGFKETQHLKFDNLSLNRFTNQMVISEELGVLKPHPKVFDHATELAGVEREQILYVGDSHSSDVIGGKNAGWKTAWFTGVVGEEETEVEPDFKFSKFPELQRYLKLI
ncbi:noncanonical pyrimidine nucleotidase, YjjG family [Rhodohalobacter sp. SW132]|uniref:YjjG family noncanonical pyrimidine nucleotidase n=1 Tax=Rhodohalobacter sp. SW132 TaxID=2293433 RepID=UPI000E21C8F1|nr:YjjG family noncanonical pyrimidine nucleotidase [Rhodohalobacter sp. SW132]REL29123.1 noncanonical pyrimidine nucleotidase, YjjG family [Rhodohalobacter sp. SW132]